MPIDVLLTPEEVGRKVRRSTAWLARARHEGTGPPFVRVGRLVRYPAGELQAWLEGRLRVRASDASAAYPAAA
jgi:predicted DNA-binding transcriptional regulator AlpA